MPKQTYNKQNKQKCGCRRLDGNGRLTTILKSLSFVHNSAKNLVFLWFYGKIELKIFLVGEIE